MKLWKKKSNAVIVVTFWPTVIGFYYFLLTSSRPKLKQYWLYDVKDLSFEGLHIYNQSFISSILQDKVTLLQAPVIFGLKGKQLVEKMIVAPTKKITVDTFDFPSSYTHQLGYQYLYPCHETEYMFYIWSIPHHIVFSYQLLAHKSKAVLYDIVPYKSALFQMYVWYKYPVFRQLAFARDMFLSKHMIEQYFSNESIYRLAAISQSIDQKDIPQLMHAVGLLYTVTGVA